MKTFMVSCVAAVLLVTTPAVAQTVTEVSRTILCAPYSLVHGALTEGEYKEDTVIPLGFIGTSNRNVALVMYTNKTTRTYTLVEAHTSTRMGCVISAGVTAE